MLPARAKPLSIYPHLKSWWWLALSTGTFTLTIAAGLLAASYGTQPPEISLDTALIPDRSTGLSTISLAIHYLLGPLGAISIIAAIGAYLLLRHRDAVRAAMFVSIVCVGWLASAAGKILVARLRPPGEITHALVLETGHTSFPSGHTAFATALTAGLVLVLARTPKQRRWTALAGTLFVALVGFSRLYLGVHYPSDIIGSILITGAALLAWTILWNRVTANPPFAAPGKGRSSRRDLHRPAH